MGFYDAFFGSSQSQYTAYAIITAIITICITILLTATDVPIGNRLLIVFFVIISLVPSIFLTLFEMTCIVTGGTEPNRWWCYAFAWILASFIIIYCIFIVIISLISLFTYNNAIDNVNDEEKSNKLTQTDSNNYAKNIIHNEEQKKKDVERFYAENSQNYAAHETQPQELYKAPTGSSPIPINPLSASTATTPGISAFSDYANAIANSVANGNGAGVGGVGVGVGAGNGKPKNEPFATLSSSNVSHFTNLTHSEDDEDFFYNFQNFN
jgi:uncharacterized membrane protein